jgi:hypothetical protein
MRKIWSKRLVFDDKKQPPSFEFILKTLSGQLPRGKHIVVLKQESIDTIREHLVTGGTQADLLTRPIIRDYSVGKSNLNSVKRELWALKQTACTALAFVSLAEKLAVQDLSRLLQGTGGGAMYIVLADSGDILVELSMTEVKDNVEYDTLVRALLKWKTEQYQGVENSDSAFVVAMDLQLSAEDINSYASADAARLQSRNSDIVDHLEERIKNWANPQRQFSRRPGSMQTSHVMVIVYPEAAVMAKFVNILRQRLVAGPAQEGKPKPQFRMVDCLDPNFDNEIDSLLDSGARPGMDTDVASARPIIIVLTSNLLSLEEKQMIVTRAARLHRHVILCSSHADPLDRRLTPDGEAPAIYNLSDIPILALLPTADSKQGSGLVQATLVVQCLFGEQLTLDALDQLAVQEPAVDRIASSIIGGHADTLIHDLVVDVLSLVLEMRPVDSRAIDFQIEDGKTAMRAIAISLWNKFGDPEDAANLRATEERVAMQTEKLGSDHADTLESRGQLSALLQRMGNRRNAVPFSQFAGAGCLCECISQKSRVEQWLRQVVLQGGSGAVLNDESIKAICRLASNVHSAHLFDTLATGGASQLHISYRCVDLPQQSGGLMAGMNFQADLLQKCMRRQDLDWNKLRDSFAKLSFSVTFLEDLLWICPSPLKMLSCIKPKALDGLLLLAGPEQRKALACIFLDRGYFSGSDSIVDAVLAHPTEDQDRIRRTDGDLSRICCFWSVLKWHLSLDSGVLDLLKSRDVALNISNWDIKNMLRCDITMQVDDTNVQILARQLLQLDEASIMYDQVILRNKLLALDDKTVGELLRPRQPAKVMTIGYSLVDFVEKVANAMSNGPSKEAKNRFFQHPLLEFLLTWYRRIDGDRITHIDKIFQACTGIVFTPGFFRGLLAQCGGLSAAEIKKKAGEVSFFVLQAPGAGRADESAVVDCFLRIVGTSDADDEVSTVGLGVVASFVHAVLGRCKDDRKCNFERLLEVALLKSAKIPQLSVQAIVELEIASWPKAKPSAPDSEEPEPEMAQVSLVDKWEAVCKQTTGGSKFPVEASDELASLYMSSFRSEQHTSLEEELKLHKVHARWLTQAGVETLLDKLKLERQNHSIKTYPYVELALALWVLHPRSELVVTPSTEKTVRGHSQFDFLDGLCKADTEFDARVERNLSMASQVAIWLALPEFLDRASTELYDLQFRHQASAAARYIVGNEQDGREFVTSAARNEAVCQKPAKRDEIIKEAVEAVRAEDFANGCSSQFAALPLAVSAGCSVDTVRSNLIALLKLIHKQHLFTDLKELSDTYGKKHPGEQNRAEEYQKANRAMLINVIVTWFSLMGVPKTDLTAMISVFPEYDATSCDWLSHGLPKDYHKIPCVFPIPSTLEVFYQTDRPFLKYFGTTEPEKRLTVQALQSFLIVLDVAEEASDVVSSRSQSLVQTALSAAERLGKELARMLSNAEPDNVKKCEDMCSMFISTLRKFCDSGDPHAASIACGPSTIGAAVDDNMLSKALIAFKEADADSEMHVFRWLVRAIGLRDLDLTKKVESKLLCQLMGHCQRHGFVVCSDTRREICFSLTSKFIDHTKFEKLLGIKIEADTGEDDIIGDPKFKIGKIEKSQQLPDRLEASTIDGVTRSYARAPTAARDRAEVQMHNQHVAQPVFKFRELAKNPEARPEEQQARPAGPNSPIFSIFPNTERAQQGICVRVRDLVTVRSMHKCTPKALKLDGENEFFEIIVNDGPGGVLVFDKQLDPHVRNYWSACSFISKADLSDRGPSVLEKGQIVMVFPSHKEAWKLLKQQLPPNSTMLCAGPDGSTVVLKKSATNTQFVPLLLHTLDEKHLDYTFSDVLMLQGALCMGIQEPITDLLELFTTILVLRLEPDDERHAQHSSHPAAASYEDLRNRCLVQYRLLYSLAASSDGDIRHFDVSSHVAGLRGTAGPLAPDAEPEMPASGDDLSVSDWLDEHGLGNCTLFVEGLEELQTLADLLALTKDCTVPKDLEDLNAAGGLMSVEDAERLWIPLQVARDLQHQLQEPLILQRTTAEPEGPEPELPAFGDNDGGDDAIYNWLDEHGLGETSLTPEDLQDLIKDCSGPQDLHTRILDGYGEHQSCGYNLSVDDAKRLWILLQAGSDLQNQSQEPDEPADEQVARPPRRDWRTFRDLYVAQLIKIATAFKKYNDDEAPAESANVDEENAGRFPFLRHCFEEFWEQIRKYDFLADKLKDLLQKNTSVQKEVLDMLNNCKDSPISLGNFLREFHETVEADDDGLEIPAFPHQVHGADDAKNAQFDFSQAEKAFSFPNAEVHMPVIEDIDVPVLLSNRGPALSFCFADNTATPEGSEAIGYMFSSTNLSLAASQEGSSAQPVTKKQLFVWLVNCLRSPLSVNTKSWILANSLNTDSLAFAPRIDQTKRISDLVVAYSLGDRCPSLDTREMLQNVFTLPKSVIPFCQHVDGKYGVYVVGTAVLPKLRDEFHIPTRVVDQDSMHSRGIRKADQIYTYLISQFHHDVCVVYVIGMKSIEDLLLKWCAEYTEKIPWRFFFFENTETKHNFSENRDRCNTSQYIPPILEEIERGGTAQNLRVLRTEFTALDAKRVRTIGDVEREEPARYLDVFPKKKFLMTLHNQNYVFFDVLDRACRSKWLECCQPTENSPPHTKFVGNWKRVMREWAGMPIKFQKLFFKIEITHVSNDGTKTIDLLDVTGDGTTAGTTPISVRLPQSASLYWNNSTVQREIRKKIKAVTEVDAHVQVSFLDQGRCSLSLVKSTGTKTVTKLIFFVRQPDGDSDVESESALEDLGFVEDEVTLCAGETCVGVNPKSERLHAPSTAPVIMIFSPPGAGKTVFVTDHVAKYFEDEAVSRRQVERVDCSSDVLVEESLIRLLGDTFGTSNQKDSLLIADEFHMLNVPQKEQLLGYIDANKTWLRAILMGNRKEQVDETIVEKFEQKELQAPQAGFLECRLSVHHLESVSMAMTAGGQSNAAIQQNAVKALSWWCVAVRMLFSDDVLTYRNRKELLQIMIDAQQNRPPEERLALVLLKKAPTIGETGCVSFCAAVWDLFLEYTDLMDDAALTEESFLDRFISADVHPMKLLVRTGLLSYLKQQKRNTARGAGQRGQDILNDFRDGLLDCDDSRSPDPDNKLLPSFPEFATDSKFENAGELHPLAKLAAWLVDC